MKLLGKLRNLFGKRPPAAAPSLEGTSPGDRDTLAAIQELSLAAMKNPGAVDIYLALGNLFRSRGDVERAVQIRRSLVVRPELSGTVKARILFELAQDYRRAGLMDRAFNAYSEAEALGFPTFTVNAELAELYAETGNFLRAAQYYYQTGNKAAHAHYLVRQAAEMPDKDKSAAIRLVKKALKITPGSPEAWNQLIAFSLLEKKWKQAATLLADALKAVPEHLGFLLFEDILRLCSPEHEQGRELAAAFAEYLLPLLAKREPELTANYYGARILRYCGQTEEASVWLTKAMLAQPEFWLARLEALKLALLREQVSPNLDVQLKYFIRQAELIKRFFCTSCGLKLEHVFYCCPRCHSWHSIALRTNLHE